MNYFQLHCGPFYVHLTRSSTRIDTHRTNSDERRNRKYNEELVFMVYCVSSRQKGVKAVQGCSVEN